MSGSDAQASGSESDAPSGPMLVHAMTIDVELSAAVHTNTLASGGAVSQRAVLTGTFEGAGTSGTVIAGGGETLVTREGGSQAGTALFVLRARDQTLARLRLSWIDAGDSAAQDDTVTATAAFDTPAGTLEGLSRRLFLAIGTRRASQLTLRLHSVE